MQLALASVLVSLVATGCLASNRDGGDDTDTDPDTAPEVVSTQGAYSVSTTLDITIEQLLPQTGADLVATLRSFSTNPANTLLDLAEDAGVPAVGEIRSALPGVVEDELEDWLDGEIAKVKIDGVPVMGFAAEIVELAETALTKVGVRSTLTINGTTATHRLTALDLSPAGISTQFELGQFPSDIVEQTTTATITTNTLVLGDHLYSVAYGEYAWQALEATLIADHGGTLREILGDAMNCPAIATTVANKCVWGQCVGHKTELTEICEKGLDEVVDRAHDEVASYRLDALHFASGTAALTDTNRDGIADSMMGTWTAELNAGQGLRHAPATFTATR